MKTQDPSHLRRGFESQLHQKSLDGNDGPLDGRKTKENNKDSQMGQVTPKKRKTGFIQIQFYFSISFGLKCRYNVATMSSALGSLSLNRITLGQHNSANVKQMI